MTSAARATVHGVLSTPESRPVTIAIARPWRAVHAWASDPRGLVHRAAHRDLTTLRRLLEDGSDR